MSGGLEQGPGPGALPDPDRVVIPDDASALDADTWAWRAEQQRLGRPVPRLGPGRSTPWRVAGRIGPMLFVAVLLVAFLSSLAMTVRPATPTVLGPAALASTQAPDGAVGGLLPRAIVEVGGATVPSRDLRPAVLVLVPSVGVDADLLDSLHLQAQAYRLRLGLVGPPERAALLEETSDGIAAGTTPVVIDPASAIADSLGLPAKADPAIVVVGRDGRIHEVVIDPPPGIQLQSVLSRAASGADPA